MASSALLAHSTVYSPPLLPLAPLTLVVVVVVVVAPAGLCSDRITSWLSGFSSKLRISEGLAKATDRTGGGAATRGATAGTS